MKLALMVDAGCDLPADFLQANQVLVAPIEIRVRDHLWVDDRNPSTTADFFRTVFAPNGGATDAESIPTPVEAFTRLLLDHVVMEHDYAFVESINRTRSLIYAHANEAAAQVQRQALSLRFRAGNKKPFGMRVINSQTLFAGQGALAAETVKLINSGLEFPKIADRVEELANHTFAYMVPQDLRYLYERGSRRGDRSVGLISVTLGGMLDVKPIIRGYRGDTTPVAKVRKFEAAVKSMLDTVMREIKLGHLFANTIVLSYGGPEAEMNAIPAVQEFRAYAAAKGVELLSCHMSMSAAINTGPRGISVGFIGQPHEFN